MNVQAGESAPVPALGSPEADKAVLEALNDAANGEIQNWKRTSGIRDWYGLSLNKDGRVARLTLAGEARSGKILPELGNLGGREHLEIPRNRLRGTIPSELGNLANLVYLDLSANDLIGEIPSKLGNLSQLKYLDLRGNKLKGEIPAELSNLTNLDYLYLYSMEDLD